MKRCASSNGPWWRRNSRPDKPSFRRDQQQRQPNAAEADRVRSRERLAERKDSEQERDRGREILQKAKRGQTDTARASREHGERHGSQWPAENEQGIALDCSAHKSAGSGSSPEQHKPQGQRKQNPSFDGEPVE